MGGFEELMGNAAVEVSTEGYAEDGTLLDWDPWTGEWIDRRKTALHGDAPMEGDG